MSKEEHIYTSSKYKIKELRMWGEDDFQVEVNGVMFTVEVK